MSSIGNRKAKQLVQNGVIGKDNFVEGAFTSAPRRPCRTPEGLMPTDIWWDRFITNSRRVAFAPERFFCWRHWKDYGTGIAGDLFVHVLSSLQYITGAVGPEKIYTTGDTDGIGDTPYIMLSYFDYPDRNGVGAFKVALTANYADGVSRKWSSLDFNIIGNDGTLRVQWDRVTLRKSTRISASDFSGLAPLGVTIDRPEQISDNEVVFAERGYNNCHVDHFTRFFDGIRSRTPIDADVMFGVQTAVPAVLCFDSFLSGKPIYWDPVNLKTKKG
jgi:predicted dehydrogenase